MTYDHKLNKTAFNTNCFNKYIKYEIAVEIMDCVFRVKLALHYRSKWTDFLNSLVAINHVNVNISTGKPVVKIVVNDAIVPTRVTILFKHKHTLIISNWQLGLGLGLTVSKSSCFKLPSEYSELRNSL